MKRPLFSLLAVCASLLGFGQSYKITWGDEIKLKKGSADLDIISADNTGLFFAETRQRSNFSIGGTRASYKLMKLDKNFSEVFYKEYDHNSNNVNPQYGDKVKTVTNFRKRSSAYGISIDIATGKMTRKLIMSNNDETILMPRHAFVVKNELFVPSWRQHTLAKTELKFAKILVK